MLGRGGLYYCFPIFITSGGDANIAASSGQWSGSSCTVNRSFGISWENSPCDILVVPALGSEVVSNKAVADVEQFSENYTKKQQKMEAGEFFSTPVQNEYLQPQWDILKRIVLFIALDFKMNQVFI